MPEPAIELTACAQDWQSALRMAYRHPTELLRDLDIDPAGIDWLDPDSFAMRVPREFAARMRRGDPNDPLLLQVLPRRVEHQQRPGFVPDPLQEAQYQATPGLIHKYHGRALIIATATCGVHCRYCFRREFDYREAREGRDGWQAAVEQIADQPDIVEAILSGGDPLSLADDKLARLLTQLQSIPHLRRLRIHTRQPIVLPQRITPALLRRLEDSRLACVMVLHSNHANEIDNAVQQACERLKAAGVTLLNQAVLLAGINDTAQAQADLSERLFQAGVLPYYLHQLDAVRGAAHFEVADENARGIMRELNSRMPGYLVPRLVREIPGKPGKLPVNWAD